MDNVDCFGYETSLTQCRQVGWGLGNCDALHREDAGVICDNTTVEEVSNNYCRRVNDGLCEDLKVSFSALDSGSRGSDFAHWPGSLGCLYYHYASLHPGVNVYRRIVRAIGQKL